MLKPCVMTRLSFSTKPMFKEPMLREPTFRKDFFWPKDLKKSSLAKRNNFWTFMPLKNDNSFYALSCNFCLSKGTFPKIQYLTNFKQLLAKEQLSLLSPKHFEGDNTSFIPFEKDKFLSCLSIFLNLKS